MDTERDATGERFTEAARRVDPDRFLCVLPAPADRHRALSVLILFNHELVRAVELPSARSGAGPIATLIRLQWWREVVEGSRDDWHREPVAVAIRALLSNNQVAAASLLAMIDGRERETEGILSLEDWRDVLLDGAGGLQRAIGSVLGVDPGQNNRLAAAGAAFACGALRRFLPALAGSGRVLLPDAADAGDLAAQRAFLANEGVRFLQQASGPKLPRGQGAALSVTILAKRDLRGDPVRFDRTGGARGLGDRLAVLSAGLLP